MKRLLTIITTLLLSSSVIFAQEADMKVGELLNTSNWFELERVYPAVAADVQTPMLKQMAEALLASNFNRPVELREKLQKLIAEHQAELGFENVCNMTVMGAMVEGYEGNYAVAADMVKAIADAVKAATGSSCCLYSVSNSLYHICRHGIVALISFYHSTHNSHVADILKAKLGLVLSNQFLEFLAKFHRTVEVGCKQSLSHLLEHWGLYISRNSRIDPFKFKPIACIEKFTNFHISFLSEYD